MLNQTFVLRFVESMQRLSDMSVKERKNLSQFKGEIGRIERYENGHISERKVAVVAGRLKTRVLTRSHQARYRLIESFNEFCFEIGNGMTTERKLAILFGWALESHCIGKKIRSYDGHEYVICFISFMKSKK
jgi:hypothetical protein